MPEFAHGRRIERPNVIGLLGADGAGKSTVATMIASTLYWTTPEVADVRRAAYADDLKLMLRELDPILGAHIIGEDAVPARLSDLEGEGYTEAMIKDAYPEYRRLLRALGTKCLRSRDGNFWVRRLSSQFDERPADEVLVVDDVRFKNEAEAITMRPVRSCGAVIKVIGRGTNTGAGEQVDEAPFDVVIDNTGALDETLNQVKEVLREWGWLS